MSEFSQPGLHPDPDTLSAFLEGVLPEHERQACLNHLAGCAECREVLSLAQDPALPDPLPVPARASWWQRWRKRVPVLSAAAVAGILVLSVSLYRLEQSASHPAAAVADATEKPIAKADDKPAEAPLIPAPPTAKAAVPRRGQQSPMPVARDLDAREQAIPREPVAAPPAPATAPPAPAAIAGTITDPAGAVVSGAAVQVRSVSGAAAANSFTDQSGQFEVAGLQPGQYEVQVTKPGFQTAAKKVDVQKDQMARADSTLAVGSVAESVEVTASAPGLSTESASVAKSKTGVAALPMVGRVMARKAEMTPAVAVATVTRGKTILRTDSAGALFRSDNAGKSWKPVKAAWQGKVVELSLAADGKAFRLRTDSGAVWVSKDGSRWAAEPH